MGVWLYMTCFTAGLQMGVWPPRHDSTTRKLLDFPCSEAGETQNYYSCRDQRSTGLRTRGMFASNSRVLPRRYQWCSKYYINYILCGYLSTSKEFFPVPSEWFLAPSEWFSATLSSFRENPEFTPLAWA